jgi:hypothetical protein
MRKTVGAQNLGVETRETKQDRKEGGFRILPSLFQFHSFLDSVSITTVECFLLAFLSAGFCPLPFF